MKKLIGSIISFVLIVNASIAQIPNFSFENWTNMGTYENPAQWGTMNNFSAPLSVYTATKGTPGNPGSYYLNLTSKTTTSGVLNGIAVSGKLDSITQKPKSGFAFNLRPQNFTGKWQHMIYGTSQGSVSVTLTKWNSGSGERDTIATAKQTLSGMAMNWASFSIPFVYLSGNYPDSCTIFLKASGAVPSNQDYLYVDNLSFSGSVAGIENNASLPVNFTVFPNPSNKNIVIELNEKSEQPTLIELRDMNGNIVLSKNAGTLKGLSIITLDISGFAKGSYFVNIIEGNKTGLKKIIIQ